MNYEPGTPIWAPGGPKLRPATILKGKHAVQKPNFMKGFPGQIPCVVMSAELYTIRLEDTGEVMDISQSSICGVRSDG